ncbi:hypothetical protein KXQ82_05600 [Mucilaginibacter sp. HMF5004]|uniref:hypothetical protein n=1 Tax=Mucilaginibacter rivuli TaxID=2857527 RepID=UPI001C5F5020|nr:hypothetical protein [Mucilaginibacter rivuli]MBW4889178.1 hypothetical protein [Mucilaginibacter rivuli]
MKTYKTNISPSQDELYRLFSTSLNAGLTDKIKSDIHLVITQTTDGIEIGQPDFYETYLYKITINGNDVLVGKSEHYIDDVNSLALEDLIDNIITGYLGINSIETILQP